MSELREVLAARKLRDLAREDSESRRVALQSGIERIVLMTGVHERKRNLEDEEDCEDEREVGEDHASPHSSRNLKPTLRTVSIRPGSPSFLRSEATWTSSVRGRPIPMRVPDLVHDLLSAHDGPRVLPEEREQVELLRAERNLNFVDRDSSSTTVDLDCADALQELVRVAHRSSRHRPHACDELP